MVERHIHSPVNWLPGGVSELLIVGKSVDLQFCHHWNRHLKQPAKPPPGNSQQH